MEEKRELKLETSSGKNIAIIKGTTSDTTKKITAKIKNLTTTPLKNQDIIELKNLIKAPINHLRR